MSNSIEKLRAKIEATYRQEVEVANTKKKRAIEALDFLSETYGENGKAVSIPDLTPIAREMDAADAEADGGNENSPSLRTAIQEAINSLGQKFTKQDIISVIAKKYPELDAEKRAISIQTTISKIKDRLGIRIVEGSKGRTPATFSRVNGSH